MKTKEELNALKEEVKTLNKKLAELTPEELEQITGGSDFDNPIILSAAGCDPNHTGKNAIPDNLFLDDHIHKIYR